MDERATRAAEVLAEAINGSGEWPLNQGIDPTGTEAIIAALPDDRRAAVVAALTGSDTEAERRENAQHLPSDFQWAPRES